MKKLLSLLLSAVLVFSMAACGTETKPEEKVEEEKPVTDEVPAKTDSEKGILMVSFGTSYNETREKTIEAIEKDVTAAYPDWSVRRAFTAQTIIDILKKRDNVEVDNVTGAMDRMLADGIKEVVVQPTHVMNGAEYDDMLEEVSAYIGKFDTIRVGTPLLTENEDFNSVISALFANIPEVSEKDTAIVFMGHGTHHFANATYSQLELMIHGAGYENVFVGTVEGFPSLEEVMADVAACGAKKVILYPLMVVAGDHATNDMAGDEEDSWKTAFTEAGYEVECRLQGLGENEGVRKVYLSHVENAIKAEPLKAVEEANVTAGEADPSNQALLVVSFGTSYNETRKETIEAIESDITAAYPDWEVRRAFTAQTVIDILKDRDKLEVDNVKQAMEKLIAEGYGTVVVQPTHVIPGLEYDDVVNEVASYKKYFKSLTVGQPILVGHEDYEAVVDAIAASVPEMAAQDTAVVLMGHGTHHIANSAYSELQNTFRAKGYEKTFVGTVEGYPTIDEVLAGLESSGVKKVVLYPFMIVAGDHASNDMAGSEEDSWKSILEKAGYEVEPRLQGLGQNKNVRALILKHLASTIENRGSAAAEPAEKSEVSFAFTGGSGKTTITCEELKSDNQAVIQFSSTKYTYVQIGETKYMNERQGENSTFTIPVNVNGVTEISAETVAMGEPRVIEYKLYLYTDGTDAAKEAGK